MSDLGLNLTGPDEPEEPSGHGHDHRHDHRPARRSRRRGRGPGCLLGALVVLVLLAGGAWFGGSAVVDKLKEQFGSAPDYAGPGTGQVLVQVRSGETSADIGKSLKAKGVVKSVQAFTDAARADQKSRSIQVGFYQLKQKMSAEGALAVLVDPDNLIQSVVTVPEGARVRDIVDAIVKHTDLKAAAVTRLLAQPAKIGLPAAAKGNPEGYLFPATYTVPPDMTARQLLSQMVAKTIEVEKDLDVASKAADVGLTPEQVLTVASILEYEANRSEDYPKVARVLYNRLDKGMALQLDSTVSYVSGRKGDVWTTAVERANDSAYNTYQHPGLPPGPIGSPGEETIKAALNPADGPWLYFVPDFENGTTLFTDDYQEHLKNAEKAKQYCRTHDEC